jgi:hypothetical protein
MSSDETPSIAWEDIEASADFHEVAQFTRGDEARFYCLRVVTDGAELWRVTQAPDGARRAIREAHLRSSEEAAAFFEDVERVLRAGGWLPS